MIRNPKIGEIEFKEKMLEVALKDLCVLRVGTTYTYRNSDLFMLSDSNTAEELEEMFRLLQDTERDFLNLLNNTIEALKNAGISFEQAEKDAQHEIEKIIWEVVGL